MAVEICNWVWRLLIGGVLLVSAYAKWSHGLNLGPVESIYDRIVAYSYTRHYSILAVEALIGLWMLSSLKPRWSSAVAGALLLAFTGILAAELFRQTPALCGCGIRQVFPDGIDPRVELGFSIGRNVLLLLGCAWLWLMTGPEPKEPTGEDDHSSHPQQASAR